MGRSSKQRLRYFKLTVLLLVPFLSFVYFSQHQRDAGREKVIPFQSFKAPETLLKNPFQLEKEKKALTFKAPITLVNFWATWCEPCVKEFPAMVELEQNLGSDKLEVFYISVDEDPAKISKFFKENLISVRPSQVFWDKERLAAEKWGSVKFPESFVVRKDSWVVEKIIGFQNWTRPGVYKYFENLAQKTLSVLSFVLESTILPGASWAQDLIHEDDKVTLKRLKKNIEISSNNYRKVKAELLKEKRSVNELEIALRRKQKVEADTGETQGSLKQKISDIQRIYKKNLSARKAELGEKKRIQLKIKEIQNTIVSLERNLKEQRTQLIARNQELNSRIQNIESLEKAENSSKDELRSLLKKAKVANTKLNVRKNETKKLMKSLRVRKMRIDKLTTKTEELKTVLERQKSKLMQFENILKK